MKNYFIKVYEILKNADIFSKKVSTVLYSSAIVCFILISVAQIGLKSPVSRRFFTNIDEFEGGYFEASVLMPAESENRLCFSACGDVENAFVYVNGEKTQPLEKGENFIKINGTEVVEIYSPKGKTDVKITDCSNSLVIYTPQREITVEKGIKILCRVGVK